MWNLFCSFFSFHQFQIKIYENACVGANIGTLYLLKILLDCFWTYSGPQATVAEQVSGLEPCQELNLGLSLSGRVCYHYTTGQPEHNAERRQGRVAHDSARLLCPVCLATDTSGLIEPVTTNCGHLLCWPCVFNWVKNLNKPSCPVCRQDIINVNTVFGLGVDRRDDDANVPPRPPSGF